MFKININYADVVNNEKVLMNYFGKNSECFSFLSIIEKPYSHNPPIFKYCKELSPYVIKYLFDKNDWLVDFLGRLKHQIMVVCRCCKESTNVLLSIPNVFSNSEENAPEDICFFRDGKLLFATINHEKMAFMIDATNKDLNFLQGQGIHFYIE